MLGSVLIISSSAYKGSIKDNNTTRCLLYTEWASFMKIFKFQPLDTVRDYYGVKIALYFAWLGFYTNLLLPPAIVGVIVFMYGVLSRDNDIPSQDICKMENVSICPPCDNFCDYWILQETCLHSKIMYLFDNETTVFFAVFMSFWGK